MVCEKKPVGEAKTRESEKKKKLVVAMDGNFLGGGGRFRFPLASRAKKGTYRLFPAIEQDLKKKKKNS